MSALDKTTLEDNKQHKVAILGYSSANISVSKLTLESYLNNCSKLPKLILLEVSWFSFNIRRTHLHNIVGDLIIKDPKLWKHYFEYSDGLSKDIKRAFKNSLSPIRPVDQKEGKLTYAIKFNAKSPFKKDYTFHLNEMEVLFPNHFAGVDEKLLEDYNAIINMCVENEIPLILFTAPENEAYSKNQKDIKVIKSIFEATLKNNPNVFYLDYTFGGPLWDKRYELLLKDSHHINENELFTKQFIKDIRMNVPNQVYITVQNN